MKNYDLIQARNGTIPQFEGQDGQPKAVTGDHGPYYQLVDVNGNPLFSENNPAHVQLTGRNVEGIVIFDSLAIADTSIHFSDTIDLSRYQDVLFIAQNTLDQEVDIWFRLESVSSTRFWDTDTSTFIGTRRLTLPMAGNARLVINNFYDSREFGTMAFRDVQWLAECDAAPTSGSLTLRAWGVPI